MPDQLDEWLTAARDEEDKEAFSRVVETTHHLIRATVLRDTANPELADEIAQEVFVRAWIRKDQYRPGTSPRAWLMAIARSQLVDHMRRRDRDRRHMRDLICRELMRHAEQMSAFDQEVRQCKIDALNHCLGHVSSEQRDLLDLVHNQGLSTADAAEVLGIKPATCRQRLSRLHRALRQCAEDRLQQTA